MITEKKKPCSDTCYEVKRADLPISCPTPQMSLWNAHPRVYLPVNSEGEAMCPYCSARFIVVDFNSGNKK